MSARADAALELYFEYAGTPCAYTAQTAPSASVANLPVEAVMDGLEPDARYFYRYRTRAPIRKNVGN